MDKIQIKDLDSETPVAEDYLVFQKATGDHEVYKSPKSEIEGHDAYVYIAYASDDTGTGFTLTFDEALNYVAILSTETEIPSPVVGDFAGLWKNYKGEKGDTGLTGAYIYRTLGIPDNSVGLDGDWAFDTSSNSYVYYKTAGAWELVNSNKGAKGDTGVGIVSVVKTATVGLVDTYTITYDDASTSTFDVTNGAKGDQGDTGISFIWMGAYSAITAYLPNTVVSYNGSSYICILATTGNLPTNVTYWELMAEKGADGEGSGDTMSPATNTDSYIPQWDGANSKTLKNGLAVPEGGLAGLTALGGKEDSSNKSTNVVTDGASDTKYPSVKAIKDYADGLVSGLLDYRGAYDASVNTFPASGGSGSAGAVMKGDMWIISVAGTLGGAAVQIGDSVIANVDTPGQTAGNWNILNSNISYVPEDVANKENTTMDTSTTKYPTNRLAKEYSDTKLAKAGGDMTGAVNEAKGTDIASSGSIDIGAGTGNMIDITGTTTITALGTVQAGTRRILRFTGALTLTHHATSLILPTGANITTVAGDTATMISLGSGNWVCTSYQRKSGAALLSSGGSTVGVVSGDITTASNVIGNATGYSFSVAANKTYKFNFHLFYSSASSGQKWAINGPTGATIKSIVKGPATTTASTYRQEQINALETLTTNPIPGSHSVGEIIIEGVIITSSTAGTLQIRWASAVDTQTNTIQANSYFEYVEL